MSCSDQVAGPAPHEGSAEANSGEQPLGIWSLRLGAGGLSHCGWVDTIASNPQNAERYARWPWERGPYGVAEKHEGKFPSDS